MISVVIPAYNEAKSISATLEGLVRQTTKEPFEVIVVNNNSTDTTAEIARRFSDRLKLRVIDEPVKGRGRARHTGFMTARGTIVFSLDADSVPPPEWLETFTAHLQNPNVVAVTGTCYINDTSPVKNTLFNIIQPSVANVYSLLYRHYWLSGFSFAIRRDIYLASGGFNTRLNAMEDADLGFRVKELGKIRYNGSLPVLVSGRRFHDNFWGGLWSYFALFYQYKYRHQQEIYLSDKR